jgi:hypothetical protein
MIINPPTDLFHIVYKIKFQIHKFFKQVHIFKTSFNLI